MKYFQKFPYVSYTTTEIIEGVSQTLTRIVPNMTIQFESSYANSSYIWYTIQDRDRPDTIATKAYGSSEFAWVVLLANNMRDIYDWPLSSLEFANYIAKKYESSPGANDGIIISQTTIHEYRLINPITKEQLVIDETAYNKIGQVASVTVTSPGTGFTARPTVTFTGGGSVTDTATAQATATLVGATVVTGGQNYRPGDLITINTSGAAGHLIIGRFRVATVNTNQSNTVLTLTINSAGSYTTLPTEILNNQTINTSGVGSGLILNLAFGVEKVTMVSNGEGYTATPTVVIAGTGGTGVTATAQLRIADINLPVGVTKEQISMFEYEAALNDTRRKIKLLTPDSFDLFIKQFQALVKS